MFGIKLEMSKVVNGRKLGRVSITLMNKALQHTQDSKVIEDFTYKMFLELPSYVDILSRYMLCGSAFRPHQF